MSTAQISAGTRAIGTNFLYNSSTQNNETFNAVLVRTGTMKVTNRQILVLPFWDRFISENIAIGIGPGYANEFTKYDETTSVTEYKNRSYSINLRLRRFYDITEKWFFVFENRVFYADTEVTQKTTAKGGNPSTNDSRVVTKGHSWGGSIRPGVMYLINTKFALEARFGYIQFEHREEDVNNSSRGLRTDQVTNTYTANFDFESLNFGFQYYF